MYSLFNCTLEKTAGDISRRRPVRAKTAYVSTASVNKAERSSFFIRRRNSTERNDSRSTVRPKRASRAASSHGRTAVASVYVQKGGILGLNTNCGPFP
jgi:hypothetical protein